MRYSPTSAGRNGGRMLGHRTRVWLLTGVAGLLLAYLGVTAPAGASTSSTAATYVVVLKGNGQAGLAAIKQAQGQVLQVNKLGIAQVSSTNPAFLSTIRGSGSVDAAANDASWHLGQKDLVSVTYVPASTQAANCAAFYHVPVNVGPEPLSACEWDDRIINASPGQSYAAPTPTSRRTSTSVCHARSSPQPTRTPTQPRWPMGTAPTRPRCRT